MEVLDLTDDRPLKRKCLTFIDEDDMVWLKGEIGGIKESMREIAEAVEQLREHVDNKLEELL